MLSSRGFTLIEALVALLVLSISLLGLAGMQLKGLQSGHVAYQRAVADLAAQDAGERLWEWLGRQNGLACPTTNDLRSPSPSGNESDPSAEIETHWQNHWKDELPGFAKNSNMQRVSDSPCQIEVTVSWDDERFTSLNNDAETENVSKLTYTVALPNA